MNRVIGSRIWVAPILFAMVAGASYASAAPAGDFDPVQANVSCVSQSEKASDEDVNAFLSNPGKLLSDNPGGGLSLSNSVTTLASSSSKAYASIMALVENASDPQNAAIGAGLASAFGECKDSQPDYAQKVQGDIGKMRGSSLFIAYAGASTSPIVASVNTPGASSNAQGGGETNPDSSQKSASNGRLYSANDPYANTVRTYDTGSGTGQVGEDISSP